MSKILTLPNTTAAVAKKTNGKRNRAAGHNFELKTVSAFKELGFEHVCSTRSESRSRDNQKIDIMHKDEGTNGRFPYNVQCKNTVGPLKYAKVLSELPKDTAHINVVFHNQTRRAGTNFITVGKYAFLEMQDFLGMVRTIKEQAAKLEALGNK
jgi:hypothetical protein